MPQHVPEKKYLKSSELGISVHRVTVYRWIRAGLFPKPIIVGGLNLWIAAEIEKWHEDRLAERSSIIANSTQSKSI